jgi:hypothetical protein
VQLTHYYRGGPRFPPVSGASAAAAWSTSMHRGHDTTLLSNVQLVPPRHVPQADSTMFDELNRAKWIVNFVASCVQSLRGECTRCRTPKALPPLLQRRRAAPAM